MLNLRKKMHHLKRISKYKLKFKPKPWITTALEKSISIKNKISKNYVKKKDTSQNYELHNDKIYRNRISTLTKRSEQKYYTKHFESNLNKIKNTWNGMKSAISMRSSWSITPTLLTFQNETLDNPKKIANIFNKYFSTISKKPKLK